MKRLFQIFAIALCVVILAVPALAAEYDGMDVYVTAYYSDGTEHVFAKDATGQPWYYVDGSLCKGAGLIFVDGYYYYVRTDGNLAYDREYSITTSNDLLPVARYTFDVDGRMVDPPSMPEGWESEWFDSWPPPTEPTETEPPESSEPVEPDVQPTTPPIIGDLEPIEPDEFVPAGGFFKAYLDWFPSLVTGGIDFLASSEIVQGVSLLHFIIAVGILCIIIGGILIR